MPGRESFTPNQPLNILTELAIMRELRSHSLPFPPE
jgi:hypothetical protein